MDKQTKPIRLLKYHALSENSIDAVTNLYFYFSHPLDLNDPFDAFFQMIRLDALSKEQVINFYIENYRFVSPDGSVEIERLISDIEDCFSDESRRKKLLLDSLSLYWNVIFSKVGVLSLTTQENSLLLWSYYTNNFGFSITYSDILFDKGEVIGPFEMLYSNEYKNIYPESGDLEIEHLTSHLNIKSLEWKHEHEWRYILRRPDLHIPDYDYNVSQSRENNKMKYNIDCIDRVTLGFKFFRQNITRTHISEDVHLYEFRSHNDSDRLRLKLINFIVDNNISVYQVHTGEDNKFQLVSNRIMIDVVERDRIYKVKTQLV